MDFPFGSLISAGASLIGGLLGKKSEDAARRSQVWANENAIRIRVKDANAAGVHPLYALGAQTSMPAAVVGNSLGEGIAAAGQDIGRAVDTYASRPEREASKALTALSIQRAGLENQLLASQIRLVNQAGMAPAAPAVGGNLIAGQGNSPVLLGGSSDPARTGRTAWGDVTLAPGLSTGQHLEDVFGDVPSAPFQLINAIASLPGGVKAASSIVNAIKRDWARDQVTIVPGSVADKLSVPAKRRAPVGPRGSYYYW